MTNLYCKPGYEELAASLKSRLAALGAETNDTYEHKTTGMAPHYVETDELNAGDVDPLTRASWGPV
jgi:hypothetical protein